MSFYGLEIAKTALNISQRSIVLTGHNIANANTPGYTRQRIVQTAIVPSNGAAKIGTLSKASIGGGVEVRVIDQIRSDYIDRQFRQANASLGYWNTRSEELQYVEAVLNELSKASVSSSMADFFKSISELSIDPVNEEIRTNVQQNALKMIETFHHYYNQLTELQSTYNDSMKVTVGEINDLLTSIADYNQQIHSFELSGQHANDLRDKRNVLLDELSGLINITYAEDASGYLSVSCGDEVLINHTTARFLEARPELTGVVSGTTGFYEIYFAETSDVFEYSDGKLKAYANLRDGNTADNVGIPYILESINTLARAMAQAFNDVHKQGYTRPYGSELSQKDINFFNVPLDGDGDEDYSLINAGNLSLSAKILENVNNIAASSQLIDFGADNTQEGNNINALALLALTTSTSIPVVGNFENFLKSTIVQLAIESSTAQKMAYSQKTIVDNLEDRRQSISGVSLDEEMVQMMTFQHAYAAASRVLTAIDEALDVLINRTGVVGR